MLVKLTSSAVRGVEAKPITIEVNITQGIRFFIVGLADGAIRESQQRIESALINSGFQWPRFRIVINLAPADERKEGSHFDLPIALGILAASKQVALEKLSGTVAMGELSLDGAVLPVKGVLPMALMARELGYSRILIPYENVREVSLVKDIEIVPLRHICDALAFLDGKNGHPAPPMPDAIEQSEVLIDQYPDFSDVRGQQTARRAMLIAAAGLHNLILIGPPGSGKSMMARRLPGIMPGMSLDEVLETTSIHSVAGRVNSWEVLVKNRPFRTPHHSISNIAMIGGGANPQPGEISLAHHGILFLDELPEFKRHVLEVLRQPLEDHEVHISRASYRVVYPANFLLVAAMNPCPCGFYNHPKKSCSCGPGLIKHYLSRISGPLMDRIDLQIEVAPVQIEEIGKWQPGSESEAMRKRVARAREIQKLRYAPFGGEMVNGRLSPELRHRFCKLDREGKTHLAKACESFGLSARAYDRILKIARTIADLDESRQIRKIHLAEAISYRNLDRSGWSG